MSTGELLIGATEERGAAWSIGAGRGKRGEKKNEGGKQYRKEEKETLQRWKRTAHVE